LNAFKAKQQSVLHLQWLKTAYMWLRVFLARMKRFFMSEPPPPKGLVTIVKVPFTKEQLLAFTKEERALVVLLGNAANQLTLFWKLMYFSTNPDPNQIDTAHQLVQGGQTQILVRQTVGLAYEAYELIRTRYNGTLVSKEFHSKLSPEGRDALDKLHKYFEKKNPIEMVRNHFAFHHPETADVEGDFQNALADKSLDGEWNWYLTTENINTFYFLSDLVTSQGMARVAGHTDIADGHRQVMHDLNQVFSWITTFVQAYFYAAFGKYNRELPAQVVAKVKGTLSNRVIIPYYIVEPPGGA
jgi:hypothetical protein